MKSAYEILSNDKKKTAYDQYGFTGDEQEEFDDDFSIFSDFFGSFTSSKRGQNSSSSFNGSIFDDLFSGGTRENSTRGADILLNVEIEFMEAIEGTSKTVQYLRKETCYTCNGSKIKPGTKKVNCSQCAGKGNVQFKQQG